MRRRTITLALVAVFSVALVAVFSGCGDSSSSDMPEAQSATTPPLTATQVKPPPRTAATPTAHDKAVAKAICAEPFYAQAFESISDCEDKMSDPKAVAELRRSVKDFGHDVEASKRKLKALDRDGDGRIDPGAQP